MTLPGWPISTSNATVSLPGLFDQRPPATKLFFDMEFTGLHQRTTLISLGIVAEDGQKFYAESMSYDRIQVDGWIYTNVIENLWVYRGMPTPPGIVYVHGKQSVITLALSRWLANFEAVEMWGDTLAYDWVLFCELFGGAQHIPSNVFYIPFDLATKFREYGIDPDVDRITFAGRQEEGRQKHNALYDAITIKACHDRLSLFAPEVSYSHSSNILIGRPA